MQISISQLPAEIKTRLKEIQQNHAEYAGFYQAGGGKGWAIFGVIVGVLSLLGMVGIALEERTPIAAWISMSLFVCWILVASIRSIKRHNSAEIKPFVFLNPLYYTSVSTTDVTYYNLWSDREDLNITHHYTNGVYTNTEFAFTFKNGSETLYVSPKDKAEELIDMIDTYRLHMLEAIESEDFESIMGHDLFFELEHTDGHVHANQSESKSGFAWGTWGMTAGIALLLGGGMYFGNMYTTQVRKLERCEDLRVPQNTSRYTSRYSRYRSYGGYGPVRCFNSYFKYFTPNLLTERAREGLLGAYKKRFEADSVSASKVREWMEQSSFEHLDGERAAKLKVHFKQKGDEALKYLYTNAIETYKQKAATAHPEARQAIVKLLELARDHGNYLVKMTYKRHVNASKEKTLTIKGKTYNLEPMAPSFQDHHNAAREQVLSESIQKAFKNIIPSDILTFTTDGDLEFFITYSLRPYSIYTRTSSRSTVKRYYRGMRIIWDLKIRSKGKLLYEYADWTRPAKNISLGRPYYSRYSRRPASSVPDKTVYDKMAKTVFDNYNRRLRVHFGVTAPTYQDKQRRKMWETFTKLGVFKDLAAGKKWEELNIKERLKKAGIAIPAPSARYRRPTYRRAAYRRPAYRRPAYRRPVYNRRNYRARMRLLRNKHRRTLQRLRKRRYKRNRYRRRPPARRNWME